MDQQPQSAIPPGWSYNPSDWGQRWPIVAVATVGFAIATYLALFQYGVIASVWEPFFGPGSRRVLTSSLSHQISRIFLVKDAALGASAYLVDAVFGTLGGRDRWRTQPWSVFVFGFAVGPLGLVSLFLVIAQPVVVGEWCTLCLVTAVISIAMIGPAMDEVLATLQHVKRETARGRAFWRVIRGQDEEPESRTAEANA